MLVGQYTQKLSGKGRVALPSRFRKETGKEILLSRWYEGSLAIFNPGAWQEILRKVTENSVLGVPLRISERFLLGGAFEITLDEQGRFVVPPSMRNYAGMKDEVVFVGLGARVEVWAKTRWEEQEKKVVQEAEEMIERVTREK